MFLNILCMIRAHTNAINPDLTLSFLIGCGSEKIEVKPNIKPRKIRARVICKPSKIGGKKSCKETKNIGIKIFLLHERRSNKNITI